MRLERAVRVVWFTNVEGLSKVYTGTWDSSRPSISSTATSAAFTPISRPVTPMAARAPDCTMASQLVYQGTWAVLAAWAASAAIGATCMLAYPATQIISIECVESTMENATEEQRKNAMDYILPKMIIGGFVTVTIASVAFASLIGPMIFQ